MNDSLIRINDSNSQI
uniref:Uncharacterized protein n=1 Tax=Anopheles funestus TaxID=62324 RepID=A0A182S0K3_ANOFN